MVSGTDNNYKRPNLFIVGAAKAGTTSLVKYLSQHKEISFPDAKELRFFVKDSLGIMPDVDPLKKHILETSILEEKSYFKVYKPYKTKYAGDASVHYLYHYEEVIPKLKRFVGDVPIIIMLRNPLDRAISNYKFNFNRINTSFVEELGLEKERIEKNFNSFWFYKNLGLYHQQVEAYLNNFSNVKVIIFERFISDVENVCFDLFEWLNLKPIYIDQSKKFNVSRRPNLIIRFVKKTNLETFILKLFGGNSLNYLKNKYDNLLYNKISVKIDDTVKSDLVKFYKEDVSELKKLLADDIQEWDEFVVNN